MRLLTSGEFSPLVWCWPLPVDEVVEGTSSCMFNVATRVLIISRDDCEWLDGIFDAVRRSWPWIRRPGAIQQVFDPKG